MDTNKTFLIVDDEELNLTLMKRFLGRHNINVTYTSNPVEANSLIYDKEWSGIITDLRMPIISGDELLNTFSKVHPNGSKVLLTAYANLNDVLTLVNNNAIDYIYEKPFSLSILKKLIPLLKNEMVKVNSLELDVRDLWEGLIVEDNIFSNDLLLLPKGTVLNVYNIQSLRKFIESRNENLTVRVTEVISE